MWQVQVGGGREGEAGGGGWNNGSCQSHFIVRSLFMNTLSGWKDSQAAAHVRLTAAAVQLQQAAGMGLISMGGICCCNFIYFV